MSPAVLLAVNFDSETDWESFTLFHGLMHKTTDTLMRERSLDPQYFPLDDFPRTENKGYLLDHYRNHQSNARLLGIPGIVDISEADFSTEPSFYDWLQLHFLIHQAENVALGVT